MPMEELGWGRGAARAVGKGEVGLSERMGTTVDPHDFQQLAETRL
jgi:hypothetical protein